MAQTYKVLVEVPVPDDGMPGSVLIRILSKLPPNATVVVRDGQVLAEWSDDGKPSTTLRAPVRGGGSQQHQDFSPPRPAPSLGVHE